MPIYAKTNNNEYNKIIDIFDTNGIDITDVYHDDQLVYTVSKDISGSTELYYNTNRYDITNFRVYGNTIQDGTPSPEVPVEVQGCGVRTGNLWSVPIVQGALNNKGDLQNSNTRVRGEYIPVQPETQYTISCNKGIRMIYAYQNESKVGAVYDGFVQNTVVTFTTPTNCNSVCVGFMNNPSTAIITPSDIEFVMLNLGSTALPYEPYGFKLPLTVNGAEYPIYLGTVPTTRRIKKLVLTGEETVRKDSDSGRSARYYIAVSGIERGTTNLLSSHFTYSPWYEPGTMKSYVNTVYFSMESSQYQEIADFKSYLAAQYANGTPVTVWYVLAEPETGIVNEPLMKIGDYADSINIVQSNPQLKLDIGENNIYISTTVPPSNMELQAKGGISVSGTPSLQITRKSEYLSDYKISGDTLQDGTQSPDMPIEVVGCGVRTGNLFDPDTVYGTYKQNDGTYRGTVNDFYTTHITPFTPDDVGKTFTFTMVVKETTSINVRASAKINGSGVNGNNLSATGITTVTFTVSSVNDYLYLGYGGGGANPIILKNIMLNEGSTALPYEPYGFKLPLTVNGTEYPIYLGEVETTRRIKKLVLTGEEEIAIKLGNAKWFIPIADMRLPTTASILWYCSHYRAVANDAKWASYDYMISWSTADNGSSKGLRIRDVNFLTDVTVADFKAYLAQQYATGTPVTVWYVLAEPETGIVNEPLMKIGDYADTVSAAQAGVTIPTVSGANVLDMASPVKPSEVYIKGKGIKPTGYGKLADVNGVNILDKNGRPIYVHGQ